MTELLSAVMVLGMDVALGLATSTFSARGKVSALRILTLLALASETG